MDLGEILLFLMTGLDDMDQYLDNIQWLDHAMKNN